MSSKCFVPNCKNTVGVSFPEDAESKKKWLDALKIIQLIPNQNSFVCLDHFDEADIKYEGAGEVPVTTIREGALPTVVPSKTHNNEKDDNCTGFTENTPEEHTSNGQMERGHIDNIGNSEISAGNGVESDGAQSEQNCEVNKDEESFSENMDVHTESSETSIQKKLPEVVMFNMDTKMCRLCSSEETNTRNIFEEKIENVPVSVAIMECIYPIEIMKTDNLSKEICLNCLASLNCYFKFRSVCLENDKKQRDLYNEEANQTEEANDPESAANKQKRKAIDDSSANKKQRVEEKMFTDSEDDYDDQDDFDSLSDFLIKKEPAEPAENQQNSNQLTSPPPLVPLQKRGIIVNAKQPQVEIDKKFDQVEEELRRVLEGQLTEEQAMAENIIIHVEDDEEEQSPLPNKLAMLSKLKLPIVIKPVEPKQIKKDIPIVITRRKIIEGDTRAPMRTKTEVTLPKGINVSVKENYKSDVGVYEGVPVNYVFNTEFCQVDGYLYEYRLCKGNIRFLRCVLPACLALAVQSKTDSDSYSNSITVQKCHSHKRPDESEKKKQMFYYVMKRKMQSDKTLNFRSVYDEVCKHDSDIKELVPLRNVINEICRHQLTYKIPQITCFEQFYEQIEDDAFQKLHFTHNGRQFYQEKFTAEDDSKAVVFANIDIVDQVSYSNLMYVDASFKIDTNEEFKYQLVTVLVWIDESYYPVLYALVNRKTQEIYKKIFEYLHDTLAPKLRPEEIVTDYEANLYYALGETYLNSSIGGSVFYYTQNLYKKICTLNLSRDLETNSYFRNIYHMLLMLPLLPVNTILDGLNNIEIQARDLSLTELTRAIFDHVRTDWIMKVTPDLFCVHRLENRINENVIAPFKKLRDFIMLSKGKMQKQHTSIVTVVEKLIELEHFLQITYSTPNKKSFARDLSSSQKKNVLKAWQYIESHPKININNFFSKVLGYIKCMENQLWIWGFYRYDGDVTDDLINATNFSIVSSDVEVMTQQEDADQPDSELTDGEEIPAEEGENGQVVMEAVIDENGSFVLQNKGHDEQSTHFENAFLKYVYKE